MDYFCFMFWVLYFEIISIYKVLCGNVVIFNFIMLWIGEEFLNKINCLFIVF